MSDSLLETSAIPAPAPAHAPTVSSPTAPENAEGTIIKIKGSVEAEVDQVRISEDWREGAAPEEPAVNQGEETNVVQSTAQTRSAS